MVKKNEPPGYPGDEAVKKAIGKALRELRLQKGLSLEQADTLLEEASQQNLIRACIAHWASWSGRCEKSRSCPGLT